MKNALISVTDKTGVAEFAGFLIEQGYRIYSTGGTARLLRESGLEITEIAALTGFPEIMDGRVKTLHPKVFGGILANRDMASHVAQAEQHGIPLFDMVVVNLYAFAETVSRQDVTLAEAIEQIDIGGVTLIRAAAKNYKHVTVVTHPGQYAAIREELEKNGAVSPDTRYRLAMQAFVTTAVYDAQISQFLKSRAQEGSALPDRIVLPLEKVVDLRYGENPHQTAALYRRLGEGPAGVISARQLHGKALSFNNYMDADAAFQIVRGFDRPAAVIIKHANPCGVAVADRLSDAYARALATDRQSAFGGIVGVNRELDADTAKQIADIFTEVVIAPAFSRAALDILRQKKNLRLLECPAILEAILPEMEERHLSGGLLLQDKDLQPDDDTKFDIVSRRKPTEQEWKDLLFGWRVVRWVKSNAIVYAKNEQTVGIGAGQMSRVDASILAVEKARRAGLELQGSVVASDAFFPFPDGVEAAAEAGATAVIQPGGSIRDQEVIEAADRAGLAMVFTHVRHFRH